MIGQHGSSLNHRWQALDRDDIRATWPREVDRERPSFFYIWSDLNNDGVIVPAEALRAIEQGDTTPAVGTTSMPRSPHPTSPQNTTSGNTLPRSTKSARVTRPDEKFVKVAERIVKRYDKNGNSELTPSEWKKMLMSPAAADTNRDGKITIHEYATWMNSRGN